MRTAPRGFERSGYSMARNVIPVRTCEAIARRIRTTTRSGGTRDLLARPWCAALIARLRVHPAISQWIPCSHVAVPCTYFEKSATRNWAVQPHQDLSVPVAHRVPDPQLSGWSRKQGTLFVQPPEELLQRLVAVRVHLDACTNSDGPLRLWPGSHRHGRLRGSALAAHRRAGEATVCSADAGDVLAMRPLVIHASAKSLGTGRRRVLHLLFGPPDPGFGLAWTGARAV